MSGGPNDATRAGDADAGERADAASRAAVDRLAESLRERGRPFALVTVVRREPPVSANVGDRAVVTPDGELTGWVGGAACAHSIAVKEALAAIDDGEPRLVGLAPDPDDVARPGLNAYPMTCHSGGTLELFVDPVSPSTRLVVVGQSPVSRALTRLAAETGYDVTVVSAPGSDPEEVDTAAASATVAADDEDALETAVEAAAAVVVATMGDYDEVGLEAALRAGVPYVGLVASDVRHDELAASLAATLDADPDAVGAAVTTPAGVDIGARTPEEIAVSVLAELIAIRRGAGPSGAGAAALDVGTAAGEGPETAGEGGETAEKTSEAGDSATGTPRDDRGEAGEATDAETAVDPVCGMTVTVDEAAETVTLDGETYYFCGEGCAAAFRDDPERFRTAEST